MRFSVFVFSFTSFLSLGCGKKPEPASTFKLESSTNLTPTSTPAAPSSKIVVTPTKAVEAKEKTVVKMTAEEMFAKMQKNFEFLIREHGNDIVEVTGLFVAPESGVSALVLKGGKGDYDLLSCQIEPNSNPYEKCMLGQTITLRTDMSLAGVGKPCIWKYVSSTGVDKPAVFTMGELQSVLQDVEKAKPHKGKGIFVKGKIAKVEMIGPKMYVDLGKQGDPIYLVCAMIFPKNEKPETFGKPGDEITIYGKLSPFVDGPKRVMFDDCVIMAPQK